MIWQLTINGLIAGSIYALVALGFTLIYGTVRFFHFAHGAICATGAYLAWWSASQMGLPLMLSASIGALCAGVLGVAIYDFVYSPLKRSRSPNLVLLLSSFGVFVVLSNLLQVIFGPDVRGLRQGEVSKGYDVFGAIVTESQLMISAICFVIVLTLVRFVKRSRLGKSILAVADDPVAASVVGIHSERIIRIVFFLGSVLAGIAGVLLALETGLHPGMGLNATIKGIIAAVIGGVGSIPGALVGGLFLGLVENLGLWGISAGWKDAIAFTVLVVFLIFRPHGIFGMSSKERRV